MHPGIKRTHLTLKNYLSCNDFRGTVEKIVRSCQKCQRTKTNSRKYGFSHDYLHGKTLF